MRGEPEAESPLRVRRASREDASRVAELSGQLGYPATSDEMRHRLGAILQDERHALFVAEVADGPVVGWVHVFTNPLVVAEALAELGGLIVDERYRGAGVGRRLMQQVEQWAHERGCRAVVLRSNVVRQEAHRFYERLGYRVVKTQRAFRKEI